MVNFNFQDKTVIIAGASGFLGSIIAKSFEEKGAKVVGLDIKMGHDLTDESFVKKIMSDNMGAHILITPFALNPLPGEASYNLFDIPLNLIDQYLKVNLLALFSVCREFAKNASDGSSIINFSSTYGVSSPKHFIYPDGFEKNIGYTITKSGVVGMSKYLATYLAPRIRVNTIIPGGVQGDFDENFIQNYSEMTPMRRMMKKDEILGAIHYLASDSSSYTTGSSLTVDGGWTSW
jgi:NAD(P)-dependent dehydrogenase (short-subunit alcohol dehydrogenase family)